MSARSAGVASAVRPREATAHAGRLAQRRWVILVVDDEVDILESFRQLLEESIPNVCVLTATSGREGIEMLERELIDLVMTDFRMPGMDGIEFLVQSRRLRPQVPRLMFTAFANDELAERAAAEAVVSAFLSKSVDPADMIAKVSSLLPYDPRGKGP